MTQESNRNGSADGTVYFIEILRGIAPVLVMWVHLSAWYAHELNIAWHGNELWRRFVVTPFRLYQDGGHLGVIIFFLISGYIITVVSLRETPAEFLVKRFFGWRQSCWCRCCCRRSRWR